MAEFLPLCDVLFTVISLAGYFCDVVFDLVMSWALAARGRIFTSLASLFLIALSLIVSQIVSIRWYLHAKDQRDAAKDNSKESKSYGTITTYLIIFLHVMQCGVLWRYAKLFIPVDLRHVKHEVRDLCMLRLVHAFLEAAPMLLLQVYLLMCPVCSSDLTSSKPFYDLNVVSATLSLFSVCWALASFSKNVRLQNVHRLVLTWLGVIFQFFWRLGTVSARVISLTMYAALYGYWVFLVIGLHWMSMFFWLISPKNVFHGERISKPRKAYLSALIAFVYVFAYVNLQEVNHRQKMVTFYVVMLLENSLLVIAWCAGVWHSKPDDWYIVPLLAFILFFCGLFFMLLYYRYFHVRRLGYEAGGRLPPPTGTNNNYCLSCNGLCECDNRNEMKSNCEKLPEIRESNKNDVNAQNNCQKNTNRYHQQAIPGVFNCRFSNPTSSSGVMKRKKKKPTTFVPPPAMTGLTPNMGPASIPFWRRPLPHQHNHQGCSSENEGSSVGSRVNIHQKLQEKKQKQLAELKIIEEEIKQGKLGGPIKNCFTSNEDVFNSLPRQPIPNTKKHVEPLCWPASSLDVADLMESSPYNTTNTSSATTITATANNNLNSLHSVNEINMNTPNNLHKASGNYKQNVIGSGSASNSLNNLNYKSINSNLNAHQTQNIIDNTSRPQSVGDLGGLSPILGSDDSGSLSKNNNNRHLPRKYYNNVNINRGRDERFHWRDRQRLINKSPRTEMFCDKDVTRVNPFQIENHRGESPRLQLGNTDSNINRSGNEFVKLNDSSNVIEAIDRHIANMSPRLQDIGACELNHQKHLSMDSIPHHESDNLHLGHYCNENKCAPKLNNIYLCDRTKNTPSPSGGETSHAGLSPREIHNVYVEYRDNAVRALLPHPPFVPYEVVPPPKTKQNIIHSSVVRMPMNRSKTPEILLAPHYLDNTRVYYDWSDRSNSGRNVYRLHDQNMVVNNEENTIPCCNGEAVRKVFDSETQDVNEEVNDANIQKSYRIPSDIDSQISLPRSYTLPREFKYYRRSRAKKSIRNDHFVASTNSSDGDVDSADDNDTDNSGTMSNNRPSHLARKITYGGDGNLASSHAKVMLRRPYMYRNNQVKHETKL